MAAVIARCCAERERAVPHSLPRQAAIVDRRREARGEGTRGLLKPRQHLRARARAPGPRYDPAIRSFQGEAVAPGLATRLTAFSAALALAPRRPDAEREAATLPEGRACPPHYRRSLATRSEQPARRHGADKNGRRRAIDLHPRAADIGEASSPRGGRSGGAGLPGARVARCAGARAWPSRRDALARRQLGATRTGGGDFRWILLIWVGRSGRLVRCFVFSGFFFRIGDGAHAFVAWAAHARAGEGGATPKARDARHAGFLTPFERLIGGILIGNNARSTRSPPRSRRRSALVSARSGIVYATIVAVVIVS